MRFRLRPLTVLVFSIPTALMGVLAACGGGDSTTTDAGPDATTDVTTVDVKPDVKPDVGVADAGCDAPSLSTLMPGDAGIDVDASGFAGFGACFSCLTEGPDAGGCGDKVQNCNADCYCRQGVIDFGTCVVNTQNLANCATTALSSGNANLQSLLVCAEQKCLAICAGGADGGTDSGPKDSGGGG